MSKSKFRPEYRSLGNAKLVDSWCGLAAANTGELLSVCQVRPHRGKELIQKYETEFETVNIFEIVLRFEIGR